MNSRRDWIPFRQFPVDRQDRASARACRLVAVVALIYLGLQLARTAVCYFFGYCV